MTIPPHDSDRERAPDLAELLDEIDAEISPRDIPADESSEEAEESSWDYDNQEPVDNPINITPTIGGGGVGGGDDW